jgi:hypothetical protein
MSQILKGYPGRPRGKKNITPAVRQELCELILTKRKGKNGKPGHGLTNAQIGARLGISATTVNYYTSAMAQGSPAYAAILGSSRTKLALEQKGKYKPGEAAAALDRRFEEAGETAEIVAAKFANEVEAFQQNHPDGNPTAHPKTKLRLSETDGSLLSINEMLAFLSDVARTGPPQYKISAIKLLDELNAIHRPAESFGPPAPLDLNEACLRLSRLFLACGILTVFTTLERLGWLSSSSTNGTTPTWIWTPPADPVMSSSTPIPAFSTQEDGSSGSPTLTTSSPSTESEPPQAPTTSEESSPSPSLVSAS